MADFQRDPLVNAIYVGIKGDIEFNLDHGRHRSTILLIYSGMDTMAFLSMPPGQDEVNRTDFIAWGDRYIHFPCKEQIPGIDLYGARCAMLHTYGAVSRMSKKGECRMVGYVDHAVPEVRFAPTVSNELVMVSVKALKDAFFRGTDRCLVDIFSDKQRAAAAESRLDWLTQSNPFKASES